MIGEVASDRLRDVVLAHLSRDCNRPELAQCAAEGNDVDVSLLASRVPGPAFPAVRRAPDADWRALSKSIFASDKLQALLK